MTTKEVATRLRRYFYRNLRDSKDLTEEERRGVKSIVRRLPDEKVIDDFLGSHFCACCRKPLFLAISMASKSKDMREWMDLLNVPAEAN